MKIKISEDLFLESQELNRFQRFMADDGFKQRLLLLTETFGIVRGAKLPNGNISLKNSFEVIRDGFVNTMVDINVGKAINKNADIISLNTSYRLLIPNTASYYWIKISYLGNNEEEGTLSIDVSGQLTGASTKFLEVLRGQPNYPSKIKFPNSALNTGEYNVEAVTSDTVALLSGGAGVFQAEADLKYIVVGTFTAGFVPTTDNKNIFVYDDCLIELVPEVSLDTPPAKTADMEFYIARCIVNGGNVDIEDKRTEFYRTKSDFEFKNINRGTPIPTMGVESVKWDINTTPLYENEVTVGWGFDSTNWTIDPTTKKITILGGSGGKFKSSADFTTGDFNGWRIYAADGSYQLITTSVKSGSQINLTLDVMISNQYTGGDNLRIVPNTEEIGIVVLGDTNNPSTDKAQLEKVYIFKTIERHGKMYLRVVDSVNPYLYCLLYSFGSYKEGAPIFLFPNDAVGHWTEKSFDELGALLPTPAGNTNAANIAAGYRFPYVGAYTGFVQIVPNPNNYASLIQRIYLGDLYGVEYNTIDLGISNALQLESGVNKMFEIVTITPTTLTGDVIISLRKTTFTGFAPKNGNKFYIKFDVTGLNLNTHHVDIKQDYVNGGTPGTLIKRLTDVDVAHTDGDLMFHFEFDGTNWVYFRHISYNDADLLAFLNNVSVTNAAFAGAVSAVNQLANIKSAWSSDITLGQITTSGPTVDTCNFRWKIATDSKTMHVFFKIHISAMANGTVTYTLPGVNAMIAPVNITGARIAGSLESTNIALINNGADLEITISATNSTNTVSGSFTIEIV